MRRILPIVGLLIFFQVSVAQQPTEQKKEKIKEAKAPYKFRPSIGAGIGVTKFYGDIEDVNATTIHRLGNRFAYDFAVKTNISRSFNVSLNTVLGKISGNENEFRLHRNFESKMFSLGLNMEYNFNTFYKNKKRKPIITPFISAGIYYANYNPMADLYDAKGNLYYYWTDGFIRNLPEGTINPDNIEILERDYNYETHLTEFPLTTIAFPVAGGFDLHLSERFTFRLNASYFFTISDKLDNFFDKSQSKKNDGYYYNSIAVFFNILSDKKDKTPGVDPDIYFYDFESLDEDDADLDGVIDLNDLCAETPLNVKVDENGCPLDTDKDGIPDYMDKEPNSKPGSLVDASGVTMNFMNIFENLSGDTLGMNRSAANKLALAENDATKQYTVHVATYGKNIPETQKQKLNKIEGLIETQKDTMTIYSVGNYANFEDAEQKQNELITNGYDQAFAATPKAVDAIAVELEKRAKTQKAKDKDASHAVIMNLPADVDVVKFKIQLTEYRLRLQIDKLADIMAREGVEMKTTTGGLKVYTIGAYDTFEQAQKIRKVIMGYGVKEAEIIGSINNNTVSADEAKQFLKEHKK